jgi:uncharacterized protein
MSQFPQQPSRPYGLNYAEPTTDEMTLSRFFNTVYAWMAVGLALTALVGYIVSQSPTIMRAVYATPGLILVISLAAFGLAWYVQSQVGRMTAGTATVLYLVYAAILGVLIASIFVIYPIATLGAAFLLTAGTFGAMSVYGFVTKRNLTGIGQVAVMLALGFIIASVVNYFLASNTLSWIITYAILILFVIITAYETQMLKNMAIQLAHNPEMAQRVAIVGALVLYISFINLFLSILRIIGDRR